jgi:peptidoglycan/LPS O-acetylase OafA/YrhL
MLVETLCLATLDPDLQHTVMKNKNWFSTGYIFLANFPEMTVGELISDRNNGLTFTRLLLSLSVLVGHCYPLGGFAGRDPIDLITQGQDTAASISVNSFMIVSGLLVSASCDRQSLVPYFIKRVLRIFPGYLFCLLLLVLLFGPFVALLSGIDLLTYFTTDRESPWTFLIKNSLLAIKQQGISGLLSNNPYPFSFAGSHWTIWPEFKGYIVIAVCGLLGFFKSFHILLIPFTFFYTISLAASYQLGFSESIVNYVRDLRTIDLAMYLLAGIILYAIRDKISVNRTGLIFSVLLLVACLVFPLYEWLMPFLLGYLLLVLSQILPTPCKNFERIGDFSYGIYLYHFPVEQVASLMGVNRLGLIPYISFTLLLTVPLAVFSWFYIEKPATKLGYILKSK